MCHLNIQINRNSNHIAAAPIIGAAANYYYYHYYSVLVYYSIGTQLSLVEESDGEVEASAERLSLTSPHLTKTFNKNILKSDFYHLVALATSVSRCWRYFVSCEVYFMSHMFT
jgi:hypothetical protein